MEGPENPGRKGCPPPEVLRRIATHEMKLNEARPWLAHLGSCGACFHDFREFQKSIKKRRERVALISIAALLFLGLASFALMRVIGGPARQQQASILDLRNYHVLRGPEDTGLPPGPPLTLERSKTEITVYLPPGSPEGDYELQVLDPSSRQVLLSSHGTVRIVDHAATFHSSFKLDGLSVGNYVLAMHRMGMDWSYYSLVVQ